MSVATQLRRRLERLRADGPVGPASAGRREAGFDWVPTDTTASSGLDKETIGWRETRAAELAGKAYNGGELVSRWHAKRATSMLRGAAERDANCGRRVIEVAGGPQGRCSIGQPCRFRACATCAAAQVRRRATRLRAAIDAKDPAERKRGRRLRWVTLTMRHDGTEDLKAELERLQGAWHRWLSTLGSKRQFRRLTWAMVVELEHGDHGWHVHAHALMWLPHWTSYGSLHVWWQKALGARGDVVGADAVGNVDVREVWGNRASLPEYASKSSGWLNRYASKGATLAFLPPHLRSQALDATWGRRLVRASQGFWVRRRARVWRVLSVHVLPTPSPWCRMVSSLDRRARPPPS